MLLKIPLAALSLSLIAGAGVVAYMVVEPSPIEVVSAKLLDATVRPGGELVWDIEYVQNKRCYIHSERVFIDSLDEPHPADPQTYRNGLPGELGEKQSLTVKIPVPGKMAFGTARLESTTVTKCNLLHEIWPIISPYNPVFFEVTPL